MTFLSAQVLSRVNKDKHRALMDTTALMEQMATDAHRKPRARRSRTRRTSRSSTTSTVTDQRVQVVYEDGNPDRAAAELPGHLDWTTAGQAARAARGPRSEGTLMQHSRLAAAPRAGSTLVELILVLVADRGRRSAASRCR